LVAPLAAIAGGDERVLVGPETGDDAGVYLLDGTALVATADFITPVCDDPRRYGRVAAANSLSDVFAMGGEVLFALNLCCFPEEDVSQQDLGAILLGAAEAVAEAGGVLLGGHSVKDHELKFGLAAIGRADPDRLITNAAAAPGDRLILTKPLGTGVLFAADMRAKSKGRWIERALAHMLQSNRDGARCILEHGATSCTDVTGFGLLGHLVEMTKASGTDAAIDLAAVPVMDGALATVQAGIFSSLHPQNARLRRAVVNAADYADDPRFALLFDPQTAGGLLASVPEERAEDCVAALKKQGYASAAIVGRVQTQADPLAPITLHARR
jgi:selenide,water dikinase